MYFVYQKYHSPQIDTSTTEKLKYLVNFLEYICCGTHRKHLNERIPMKNTTTHTFKEK